MLDEGFGAAELVALGKKFRNFEPAMLETYSLPVVIDSVGEISIVRAIESESEPILDIFRGAVAAQPDPAEIGVRVLNGTGRELEGTTTGDALAEVGFDVAGIGDADPQGVARTIIRFAPEQRSQAEHLVRYLQAGATLVEDPDLTDGLIEITTGFDYRGVNDQPAPATTTTSTAPAPGATTTITPITSTTRYGVVPGSEAEAEAANCR